MNKVIASALWCRDRILMESLIRSLLSEDGIREKFLEYNVGSMLIELLEGQGDE